MFRILQRFWVLISLGAIALMAVLALGMVVAGAENYHPQVAGARATNFKPVVIYDNGVRMTAYAEDETVKGILTELGITWYPEDKIKVFPDPAMGLGTQISIRRINPVTIVDGLHKIKTTTAKDTVKEVLAEKKIKVGEKDKLNVDLSTVLTRKMTIVIVRVKEKIYSEEKKIAFGEITKEDANLMIGKSYTEQEGKIGKKKLTYRIVYENGRKVKKELIDEKVLVATYDQIVVKGTMRPYLGEGLASFYYYLPGSCAHRTLPFGTKILVRASNGKTAVCTVLDRGPFNSRIIDLSSDVFSRLAPLGTGVIHVRLERY